MEKSSHNMSIATKLLLFFGASLVILSVSVMFISLSIFNIGFLKNTDSDLKYMAKGLENTLSEWQLIIYGASASIADRSDLPTQVLQNDKAKIAKLIQNKIANHGMDILAIIARDGTILGSVGLDNTVSLKNAYSVKEALHGSCSTSTEELGSCPYAIVAAVPIFLNGYAVGCVVSAYDLTKDTFTKTIKEACNVECTIFKDDLRVSTTLKDKSGASLAGTKLTNTLILQTVLQGGTFVGKNIIMGEKYSTIYFPLVSDDGTVTGMAFIAKSIKTIESILHNTILVIIPVVSMVCLLLLIVCAFFAKYLMKRINHVGQVLKVLATGDADLTQRIKLLSHDEIGRLVIDFNAFCDKLHNIISQIKFTKITLSSAGENLDENIKNTQEATKKITDNIQDARLRISEQTAGTIQAVDVVNGISSDIKALDSMILNQASSVTESTASIQQMVSNINNVNSYVTDMTHSFSTLESNIQTGITSQEALDARIKKIATESNMLEEANDAISSIAQQTNLLAMNAAIEAAHAGEVGKGFAVVADEIRKLAESSSEQSRSIKERLDMIRTSIDETVEASNQSNETFDAVSVEIKKTSDIVKQIKQSMDTQEASSMQIGATLKEMNNSTQDVKTASQNMSQKAQEVSSGMTKLSSLTVQMKDSINTMAQGAKSIESASDKLGEGLKDVNSSIGEIASQIDLFKV